MKVNRGIKDESEVTIQIGMKNIVGGHGNGNIVLNLTDTQVKKLLGLTEGKQMRFTLSKTQLMSMKSGEKSKKVEGVVGKSKKVKGAVGGKEVKSKVKDDISSKIKEINLAVTAKERGKINNEIVRLMTLLDLDESKVVKDLERQENDGIGAIFKLALPFVKKVLPKIASTLGLAGLSGLTSGLTHRAVKGKGLQRAGVIKLRKSEMKDLMRL